jgi:hypothetical protein
MARLSRRDFLKASAATLLGNSLTFKTLAATMDLSGAFEYSGWENFHRNQWSWDKQYSRSAPDQLYWGLPALRLYERWCGHSRGAVQGHSADAEYPGIESPGVQQGGVRTPLHVWSASPEISFDPGWRTRGGQVAACHGRRH